jgi:hypothetical protein
VADDDAVLAEVISLELKLLDPAVRASAAAVGRLLHPDFREFGVSGETWDGEAISRALADTPGDAVAIADMTARLLADEVVLITYVADDGHRASLRSSLWVKGDDGWRVIFHQGTPVRWGGG